MRVGENWYHSGAHASAWQCVVGEGRPTRGVGGREQSFVWRTREEVKRKTVGRLNKRHCAPIVVFTLNLLCNPSQVKQI